MELGTTREASLGFPTSELSVGRRGRFGAEMMLLDFKRGAQAIKRLSDDPDGRGSGRCQSDGCIDRILLPQPTVGFRSLRGCRIHLKSGLRSILFLLDDRLSSLAVSDDGRAVLVASADSGTGAVYLIHSEQNRVVAPGRDVRAMSISQQQHERCDCRCRSQRGAAPQRRHRSGNQLKCWPKKALASPIPWRCRFQADNRRVFVLNSGAPGSHDAGPGDRVLFTHLPTNGSASKLQRLSGDVFQLTDDFKQPMLLLDGGTDEPRIVFTPKALDSERSGGRTALRDRVSDKRRPLPLRQQRD